MPFVPREEYKRLQADNAAMAERLRQYEYLKPFIGTAAMIQAEVMGLLQTDVATTEIGDLAFKNVVGHLVDEAKRQKAAEYEQAHRKKLYERTLVEVEATEGPAILAEVQGRLDTDADLAAELRKSARKELIARARGVAANKATEEQQEVINAEAERQMQLDRYDVAFALTGRLALNSPELQALFRPDDRLVIMFQKTRMGKFGLTFRWAEDADEAHGWVLAGAVREMPGHSSDTRSQVQIGTLPKDRFVALGCKMPDLTNGKKKTVPDLLAAGHPLALGWRSDRDNRTEHVVNLALLEDPYDYHPNIVPATILTTDFQTHDLFFAE